ncbi:MAG: hypothetical protein IJO71_07185 [Microbacterium sp.]|jgi:hypothetical protein|uniref:hypothetical protein n=1 Tax=Microbacterium sp. TaxID=51671 RepID=UPI0025F00559|nr:hypothetical protein [Microbacterium sp.]MBQ9916968.1 hypothetical protein [Microbacterium sp.]
MPLDASALLDGPRGRRLCLEILLEGARRADTPETRDAVQAVFWAAHGRERGASVLLSFSDGSEPFVEPDVTARDAAAALAALPVPAITPAVLGDALEASVDAAMYWQPPDGTDALAAEDAVTPVLAAVAIELSRSPHAQAWGHRVDPDDQWTVQFDGADVPAADPRSLIRRWRTDTMRHEVASAARDPGEPWSGTWWSTPPRVCRVTTGAGRTREPLRLRYVEDGMGWQSARVRRVVVPEGPVVEVAGPADWAALCERHPLVVTASRRGDWEHIADHRGVWVQPDWASVAEEAVGVHVSVAGYLATAGRGIVVGDIGMSVMAGWSPDETFWFDPVSPTGPDEHRVRDEASGPWHPA